MANNWFVLMEQTLASGFCPEPGKSRWYGANKDPHCLIHVPGVKAKRIFQVMDLPEAIIWEEKLLGTCVWTLPHHLLLGIPEQV